MIEKLSILNQHIIDCLQNAYGIEVTVLTPLLWGADMNASVYKALATDKSTYFVKLKRGHSHNVGPLVIELLHDAGISQVIPLLTDRTDLVVN